MKPISLVQLVAVSSLLAACGGGGSGSSPKPASSAPAVSSAASSVVSSAISSEVSSASSLSSISSADSSSSSSTPALSGCEAVNTPQGYAEGTTGGADVGDGNFVVTVSTGAQLISALNNSNYAGRPLTIYVDGTLTWENTNNNRGITINRSNVSVIGRPGARFTGLPISITGTGNAGVSNIIIRNLILHEVPQSRGQGDIITLDGRNGPVRDIWIDHNELYNSRKAPAGATCPTAGCDLDKDYYDELVSGRADVSNVTISWNYLHDSWKTSLWGSSDDDTGDRHITFQGNHWYNVGSRLPLFRYGEGHVFNNYYQSVSDSGINSRMGARFRIDGNVFENVRNPIVSIDSRELGFWTVDDNSFSGISTSNGTCTSANPPCYGAHNRSTIDGYAPTYAYTLLPSSEVKTAVLANAGAGKINACLGFDEEDSDSGSSSSAPAVEANGPSAWNVYSADVLPDSPGAITLADGGNAAFRLGGNEAGQAHPAFNQADGVVNFDTTADSSLQHHMTVDGVVAADGVYPKYFTLLAGVTGASGGDSNIRGLDIEVAMADADTAGSRVKMILRPGNGGVQLEQADGGQSVASYTSSADRFDMGVFRIYQLNITLTSATTGHVQVYANGDSEPLPNLSLTDVTMRASSAAGHNYLRFGDGGGQMFKSSIDWLIWTSEGIYTPAELQGLLPENLGVTTGY